MYTAYFGLSEPPFSIAPDPRFLYMSRRHREAFAYLVYGVDDGSGFVQLTGEVGTGKTTLCRCMLEQVPANVDIALILNPRISDYGLVASICDELRIPHEPGKQGLKELVDTVNNYLLAKHAQGRRTTLVVDEAQNLSTEVLEQIRLLTNLETDKEKLLRIILIGQPELKRKLAQEKLRQLAQRITARYHLFPLSFDETGAYIRYRLAVAGQKKRLFTRYATWRVYKLSGGVPRLINVICDRALLGAYSKDKTVVGERTVRRAAAEVFGKIKARRFVWAKIGMFALLMIGFFAGIWTYQKFDDIHAVVGAVKRGDYVGGWSGLRQLVVGAPVSADGNIAGGRRQLEELLRGPLPAGDKNAVLRRLSGVWKVDVSQIENGDNLCEKLQSKGLRCLEEQGTWNNLRNYNRPAVIEVIGPQGQMRYVLLSALEDGQATLETGGRVYVFSAAEIDPYWFGKFLILWSSPLGITLIQPGTYGSDVVWLRERLNNINKVAADLKIENDDARFFDNELKARVIAFQRGRSRRQDGVVDIETLIHLNTALNSPLIPLLSKRGH